MREIKFRAWNPTFRKMLSANQIFVGDFGIVQSDGRHFTKLTDNIIPLQYTGLKDKKDKEIYEGDIVIHEYPAGYTYYEVRFGEFDNGGEYEDSEVGVGWYFITLMEYYSAFGDEYIDAPDEIRNILGYPHYSQTEVIGNIYENQELLK